MKRRLFSIFVALALCLSLLPAPALALDPEESEELQMEDQGVPAPREDPPADTVAVVTKDGQTAPFSSLQDAVNSVKDGETATIKLLANVTSGANTCMFMERGTITLDCDGYSITSTYGTGGIGIALLGGDLTILNATVEADVAVDIRYSPSLTIESGTFTGGGADGSNGTLNIRGSAKKVSLRGGTFINTNEWSVIQTVSPLTVANLLADSYCYRVNGVLQEKADCSGMTLAPTGGTVTVEPCQHPGAVTSKGDGTHSVNCLYCGKNTSEMPEQCEYAFTGTTGTCGVCGDQVVVTVSGTENLTFTGSPIEPEVTVTRNGTPLTEGTKYKVEYADNINAGTASVSVTMQVDHGTYRGTFTIQKATATLAWKDPAELTITYSKGVPNLDTYLLLNDKAYSGSTAISYATAVNGPYTQGLPQGAGVYYLKAQIPAQENYTAAATADPLTLTIEKATPTIDTLTTGANLTYNGEAQRLLSVAGSSDIGVPLVYSMSKDGPWSEAVPTGTDAGDYDVWYKVEETDNYKGTDPTFVTATIRKAPAITAARQVLSVQNKQERTYTLDLKSLVPEPPFGHYGPGNSDTVSFAQDNTNYSIDVTESSYFTARDVDTIDGVLTIPVHAVQSELESAVATIEASCVSWNFAGVIILVDVYSTNKTPVTITGVTAQGWTYDGTGHPGYTGTPTAEGYNGDLKYSYAGTLTGGDPYQASPTPPTEAGQYTVTISIPSDDQDYTGSIALPFIVRQAAITVKADNKTATVGQAKPELTYTASGLAQGDALEDEPALTCEADMTTPGTYPIEISGAVLPSGNNYKEIVYQPGTLTVTAAPVTPPVDPNPPVNPDPPVEPDEPLVPDGERTKLDIAEGIPEVPEGLRDNPELNTPAKLETAMRTKVTQTGIPSNSTAVYDVALMVSADGGRTWTRATKDNFPAAGLVVTLPYPAGTDRTYQFTVVHMFTASAFGKTPGDTESPAVTNTAEGLRFTVTGLSPISVGWTRTGGGSGGSSGGSGYYGGRRPSKPSGQTSAGNGTRLCDGGAGCLSRGFTDLGGPGAWYHEAVDYVLRSGVMNGYSDGTFRPGNPLTRAQFAQILFNQAGRPAAAADSGFADVAPGAWCADAIAWAAERGIAGGYGDGTFRPDAAVTREQLAVMLWRYAGSPAAGGDAPRFSDLGEAGAYSLEALCWAVENGVMSGYGDGRLNPKGPATRAQAAQMLKNFLEGQEEST